jgi:hypothetical protein
MKFVVLEMNPWKFEMNHDGIGCETLLNVRNCFIWLFSQPRGYSPDSHDFTVLRDLYNSMGLRHIIECMDWICFPFKLQAKDHTTTTQRSSYLHLNMAGGVPDFLLA